MVTEMNKALIDNPTFDAWVKGRTPARRWGKPEELVGAASSSLRRLPVTSTDRSSTSTAACSPCCDLAATSTHLHTEGKFHAFSRRSRPTRSASRRHAAVAGPGPGEVKVSLAAGGICGSDLHYYQHGGFGTIRLKEPMILGHEVAGTVAAIGEGVTRVKVGDHVAVNPSHPCGHCRYCIEGHSNQCLDVRFYGSAMRFPHVQGAFRDEIVITQEQAFPVKPDVPLERGGLRGAVLGGAARGDPRRLGARQEGAGDRMRSDRLPHHHGGAAGRGQRDRRDRRQRTAARHRREGGR